MEEKDEKDEVVIKAPQWLLEKHVDASKDCPGYSLSDNYSKIIEAKGRGEDPIETVFGIPDDDINKYALSRRVKSIQIDGAEDEARQRLRREQRLFVSDNDDDADAHRDVKRESKSAIRKPSNSFVVQASGASPRSIETSRPISNPTVHQISGASPRSTGTSRSTTKSPREETFAEASKTAAARRPSTRPHISAPTQANSAVVSGEDKKVYEARPLPKWLQDISQTTLSRGLKQPNRNQIQALRAIEGFKDCIRRCENAAATHQPKPQQQTLFEELRNHVHKAEITLKGVDKYVVRKTNMLTVENGLPRIFLAQKADYPWDLKADAWQLYLRWYKQDFRSELLRGIITRKTTDRSADRIDPEWLRNPLLKCSANYHGEGNLVNGQWWPTQLCTVRDGAHGSAQGGIWGQKGQGAYSIVLSGANYRRDRDDGIEIWYSGTASKNNEPTENTQRLMETCEEFPERPVRVLRSSQLHHKNPYRPEYGLRYDGLYHVVGMERIEEGKEDYVFRLVRLENQNPIRCEDNAARRPTKFEVAEYLRLKQ